MCIIFSWQHTMKINLGILILCYFSFVCPKLLDTSGARISREKRSLIFLEGINWVQMIVGIGIPIELRDQSITLGTVAKAYYLLPTNSSIFTRPSIDYARKRRSASRWIIYELIEKFLERYGFGDGKACLLKTICEVASNPFEEKSGLLAEIVHALLTPSSTQESLDNYLNTDYHAAERIGKKVDNCDLLFSGCQNSVLKQFTRFIK